MKGKLYAFAETGTEGIIRSLLEDGKTGYDSLYELKPGDHLMVFDDSGQIVFSGIIDFDYDVCKQPSAFNPNYIAQTIKGNFVHGIQKNYDPEKWFTMFLNELTAETK